MDFPVCNHLSEYRDGLDAAQEAYRELVAVLDRYRLGHDPAEVRAALPGMMATWMGATARLRSLLVELVDAGRVVLPRRKEGMPRCARCRRNIHRLEFEEWDFTADGAVLFRGETVVPAAPVTPRRS